MNVLTAVEQRVNAVHELYPTYPRDYAAVLRLVGHIDWQVNHHGNRVLATWGITYDEYNVLLDLYGSEGCALSTTTLAKNLSRGAARFARAIRQLEAGGFVERNMDATDRRRALLTLTDAGKAVLEQCLPMLIGFVDQSKREFVEGDMAELARLLKKLLHQFMPCDTTPAS